MFRQCEKTRKGEPEGCRSAQAGVRKSRSAEKITFCQTDHNSNFTMAGNNLLPPRLQGERISRAWMGEIADGERSMPLNAIQAGSAGVLRMDVEIGDEEAWIQVGKGAI